MLQLAIHKLKPVALATLIASTPVVADQEINKETMSHADKYSYLQGYTLSQRLQNTGMDLNADTFTRAMHDGLTGKPSIFSDEERNAIVKEQKEIDAKEARARQEKAMAEAAASLEKGKAFLEENAKQEDIKSLISGVQYRVLTAGNKEGKSPKPQDRVTVHYEGRRIDGKVFDSSYKRGKPSTFSVSGVVQGFSDALQNMKPGDIWEVFIPPHLGYGERRKNADIGPNETLIFKLELIKVN